MTASSYNFVRAQSDILPNVDTFMLKQYIAASDCYNAVKIKGVKVQNSMRKDYVDAAIGYVQLQRVGDLCTVRRQICPEHKVKKKNYQVLLQVNEKNEEILVVKCPVSEGGCKHALAFLMWVHQKSTQPAPTEVECYWKNERITSPKLSHT